MGEEKGGRGKIGMEGDMGKVDRGRRKNEKIYLA